MSTAVIDPSSFSSSVFGKYDVFLSFRGEDTRHAFTAHLYDELMNAGFCTFLDDDWIEMGKDIKSELEKAIKESRISIVVLSENYVSSPRCLNELVMILEYKETCGLVVLPVFYELDPSDFRRQTGTVGEVFLRHEKQSKLQCDDKENDKITRWKAALTEVANLVGIYCRSQANRYECKCIEKIVKVVQNKLGRTPISTESHLVGIDSHIWNINMWLNYKSSNVDMLVIFGTGGIGKTTIAKLVYNQNCKRFGSSSFLTSIREFFKQPNGLLQLQRMLLSDILGRHEVQKPSSIDDGWKLIKHALSCKRVLLVLDDVDQFGQLDDIIGMKDLLSKGSKIIITTRRLDLLKAHQVYAIYKIESLNPKKSLELFSWYAFGQKHPKKGYMKQAKRFVDYCDGLPLALKVLGSSLSHKRLVQWDNQLEKLKESSKRDIMQTLKISYESLEDGNDKNIFLDIVCFFVGKDREFTTTVLQGCNFYAAIGIQNLIDRCLLTIDQKNKLVMHHLIQSMGKQIVRENSEKYPEKCSRLWNHIHSLDVLRSKTGTEDVEGLIFDVRNLNTIAFETDAFQRMLKLRILELNYVHLNGPYKVLSKKLKWFCWHGCPLKSIPNDFPLEGLVALDMRYSSLKHLWKETKFLKSLKILNVSHSPFFVGIPDFSMIPNIEKLLLKDCPNLVEIHASLSNLNKLIVLNLKNCKRLKKLPRNIGMMKSLEQLIISGCLSLEGTMEELKMMSSLKVLLADRIFVKKVLSPCEKTCPWLTCIWPWLSKQKRNLGISWTSLPSSLVEMSLVKCNLLDSDFPEQFSNLSMLQRLNLGSNPIQNLPDFVKGLRNLKKLGLKCCTSLQDLEWSLLQLKELDVRNCSSLEKITYQAESSCYIMYTGCEKLYFVQGCFKVIPVREMDTELLNTIGFFGLDSMANIKATISHGMRWCKQKCPLEVFYEFGIFSTNFPGGEIPDWFSYKSMGSVISLDLPSHPAVSIRGLNMCLLYTISPCDDFFPVEITTLVWNKSKNLITGYKPRYQGVPEPGKPMVWLSYWVFGIPFEGGDHIEVSFGMRTNNCEFKECGIHLLFDEEEEGIDQQSFCFETFAVQLPQPNLYLKANSDIPEWNTLHDGTTHLHSIVEISDSEMDKICGEASGWKYQYLSDFFDGELRPRFPITGFFDADVDASIRESGRCDLVLPKKRVDTQVVVS